MKPDRTQNGTCEIGEVAQLSGAGGYLPAVSLEQLLRQVFADVLRNRRQKFAEFIRNCVADCAVGCFVSLGISRKRETEQQR